MSADLGLAVAGAVVGGVIGGPQGALIGWSLGSAAGSALFGPKINQEGPRLQDLSIQSSAEGQSVYKIYGTMRTAGNIVWGKPITEHKKKKKSGGKGGGGGQTTTTYNYTVDFAVGLCEGPITGIVKLWADGKLFYDVSALTAEEQAIVDAGGYLPDATARFQSSFASTTNIADTDGTMRIYSGSETQLPDPLIEADLGVGNTPAYRGIAYIVFDNFALKDYGNRIPNITAEVIANGETSLQYLGKIGKFPSFSLPEWRLPIHAQVQAWSHYARAGKTLAVSVWYESFSTTNIDAVDPFYVYPSGIETHLPRMSASGNWGIIVNVFSDVPAFFTIGGSTTVVRVYAAVNNEIPVLIGSFLPDDGGNGFLRLSGNYGYSSAGVYYTGGEVWVYNNENDTLYFSALINVTGTTRMEVKSSLAAFHTGPVIGVFIGIDEIYILSNASNPMTLTVVDKVTMAVLRTHSLPITPPEGLGNYPGVRMFSEADGQIYFLVGPSKLLYYLDGDSLNYYGAIPSFPGQVKDHPEFSVSKGIITLFQREAFSPSWATPAAPPLGYLHHWSIAGLDGSTVALSTIVSDVCESAGLDSSLINVTDLASTQVRGYIRNAQMTARAALEPLASGLFFDATESDGKIVFRHRGGATAATIDYDDLGAANPGAQEDRLVTTITQDNELPIELNLRYADLARDFQVGSQRSRRQIPASKKIDTIDMPISWSGSEAKQAVEKLHYTAWEAQARYQFALPIKYMRLEPGDPILLPVNGVNKRVRLTKTVLLGSVIQCEAEADYAASYVSEAIAADNPAGPQVIKVPGTTIMHLLDIPILQDADNDAGLYIAATGTGSGWSGAAILKSSDGLAFDEVDTITTESVIGSTSTLLPSGPTTIWDDGSTVNVRLIKDALTSTTDIATLAGANTAVIGAPGRWEIVSFATATLNADGTYTLSRLLRGRLGTEWAVGLHAIGDAFVLLEADVLARNVPATSDIGVPRYYKPVSFGGDEGDVVTYTHQAVGLECYAPTHIRGRRHSPSTNDWAITWVRRTRVDGAWRDYVDVPVGEAAQSYEVDIMSGSTVKRTIAASSESATYTAAMQTTDFGAAQSTITVNIYQLSATVGRGYVGTKTL